MAFPMPATLEKIVKRDGRVVAFRFEKIAAAVEKAFRAVGEGSEARAHGVAAEVVRRLETRDLEAPPTVEEVQDLVEQVLMDQHLHRTAKAYILYRHRHAEVRGAKRLLGVTDDLGLSFNAIRVLEKRYLRKDAGGRTVETPAEMFRRVARAVAAPEARWGGPDAVLLWEARFEEAMRFLRFLPNSPTLMNAGTDLGNLAACFVIPVEDSIRSIFQAVKDMALIHQSGGGTGFSFSRLRPQSDVVRSTGGVASGPVSFIHVFDAATEAIKQGGRRRGANMAILSADHPDVLDFITSKGVEGVFRNFNISVAVDDAFMRAVVEGRAYGLVNPRTGAVVRELPAADVFDLIVDMAWKCGDPGLVFIDAINRDNPTPGQGRIEATNPCGEEPLLPYEACNLGSVNLARLVRPRAETGDAVVAPLGAGIGGYEVDWDLLGRTVELGVRFLDDVIEASRYGIPEVEAVVRRNRKVGIGVMGFADLLIRLGIPYTDPDALALAERLMAFVQERAVETSRALARERGPFPAFAESVFAARGEPARRNATVTTIAPTGTISIIAGTTSGIEPLYAVAFVRNVLGGDELIEVYPLFEAEMRRSGLFTLDLMKRVLRDGSLAGIEAVPEPLRRVLVAAADVPPEWHVRVQAAFQRHTENGVSKTINLPHRAPPSEVRKAYLLAHELGCKGITVFRSGSRSEQVLAGSERAAEILFEKACAREAPPRGELEPAPVLHVGEGCPGCG